MYNNVTEFLSRKYIRIYIETNTFYNLYNTANQIQITCVHLALPNRWCFYDRK